MIAAPKFVSSSGIERKLTEISGKHFIGFEDESDDGPSIRYYSPEKVDETEKKIINLRDSAKILLSKFPGYLHSNDRTALKDILSIPLDKLVIGYHENRIRFSKRHTSWMFHRVKDLKEANIPQVFLEEFENSTKGSADPYNTGLESHRYPTLDAVINVFVKDFVKKKNRRINKAVDSEDILFFRNYALREAISSAVCQEIIKIVEEKYKENFSSKDSKEYVLARVSEGFEHLKKELSVLPLNQNLKVYDFKENPEEIVSELFWYTQFTDNSVDLIIKQYFSNLSDEFLASNEIKFREFLDSKETAANVLYLFPDKVPDFKEKDDLKAGYIKDKLRNTIEHYAFKYSGPACDSIELPKTPASRELVAGLLDELHLEKVSGLSGEELVDYINNLPQEACVSTQPKTFETLSKAVYDLIGKTSGARGPTTFAGRLRTLGFDKSKKYLLSQLYNHQKPAKKPRYNMWC